MKLFKIFVEVSTPLISSFFCALNFGLWMKNVNAAFTMGMFLLFIFNVVSFLWGKLLRYELIKFELDMVRKERDVYKDFAEKRTMGWMKSNNNH